MPSTSGPQLRFEAALRAAGVSGWERESADIGPVRPDVFFRHVETVVFVDGCAWHGCPDHWRPHRNGKHGLSREKMLAQRLTDRRTDAALRAKGMTVFRFWEHEIRADADGCARKVADHLRSRGWK